MLFSSDGSFIQPPTDGEWKCTNISATMNAGRVVWTSYAKNDLDLVHNSLGPAMICFDHDKAGLLVMTLQRWFFNGKLHRLDGPAEIYRDGMLKRYMIDGQEVHEQSFCLNVIQYLLGVDNKTANEIEKMMSQAHEN